jgi:DNA-binding transcriptional ArsR family regulator
MLELSDPGLDAVYRALANPGRRSMLVRLSAGPATLSELAAPLGMTLSAVEQHFRTLELCGLVTSDKRGRTRTCRLEARTVRTAEQRLGGLRLQWEGSLDRLGDFLATAPKHDDTKDAP